MAEFPIQSSLNAGEISPELYGEVDLKKYTAAATTLRNMFVNYKGGAMSRGGLALVNLSRQPLTGTGPPQLIPFQFNITQGYALELGDHYMRFIYRGGMVLETAVNITGITNANPAVVSVTGTPFSNGDWVFFTGIHGMTQLNGLTMIVAGATSGSFTLTDLYGNAVNSTTFGAYTGSGTVARIYTISTPYLAEDLPYLKYAQSADVMKLTCSNPITGNEYPPYDLKRFGSTNWTLTQTSFAAAIQPPSTLNVSTSGLAAAGGVDASFGYRVTAVDQNGNESIASIITTVGGVDIEVNGGTNTVTWSAVPGAAYYNVYRAPAQVYSTSKGYLKIPTGSIFAFVGSAFGTTFADSGVTRDLQQTPPVHSNPFAPGQIEAVTITNQGTNQNAINYSISTSTGSGFIGNIDSSNGMLGAIIIQDHGQLYAPGDTISFNGASFASGSIGWGSATDVTTGATITLNGVTWQFVTTVTGNNQTAVTGSLGSTLALLASGLAGSGNPSLTVASYRTDGQNLIIQYNTAGTAGNSYTLASTDPAGTPSGATLTGGSGSGSAGTHATGDVVFSANPTNGETIILNGVTWTFVSSGATGNQTNILGTLALTLTQLASDLNASSVPNIHVATYASTPTQLNVTYATVGTTGNSYTLNKGSAGSSTSGPTLSGGSDASSVPTATLVIGPQSGTYPGVVTFFQQRVFYANSFNSPDTLWATQTGNFNNMDVSIPTSPTDAITASPWTEQVDGIQWLVPMPGGLIAMTGSRAWQVLGQGSYNLNAAPITPSSIQAQPQAFNGCSAIIVPIVIEHDILYVESIGNAIVRDLSWNFWVNIYTGSDLTLLSSHMFLYRQIVRWAWARVPYKLLWCVGDDGVVLSLTYLKEQEVYGWARHDTQGLFKSVCSVTEPPANGVYFIVQRFGGGFGDPFSLGAPTITAQENYDPTTIATGFAASYYSADQGLAGMTYDRVRRQILTSAATGSNRAMTNTTGFTLWDGNGDLITNGSGYDGRSLGSRNVMARPVDLPSTVAGYSTYDPTSIVPTGLGQYNSISTYTLTGGSGYVDAIYRAVPLTGGSGVYARADITVSGGVVTVCTVLGGYLYHVSDVLTTPNTNLGGSGSGFQITVTAIRAGSDGTWRRIVNMSNDSLNGNAIAQPSTGDFWTHSNAIFAGNYSCLVYVFRRSNNFGQQISPMLPFDFRQRHMDVRGMTNNYFYTLQYLNSSPSDGSWLVGTPLATQSAETALDFKLPYFWFANPVDEHNSAAYISFAFSTDNRVYQLSTTTVGNWTLTRFDEPTGSSPYNTATVGGGFTNITPWGPSTGPNTYGVNYLGNNSDGLLLALYYLPVTNELVCISRFYPQDKIGGGTQSDFFFDCTYVGSPTSSPTFDYHHAFVTGFMDVNWNPLVSSGNTAPTGAAYAVIDAIEIDPYLTLSSYLYSGADYTERWFAFTTLTTSPGSTVVPPTNVVTPKNTAYFQVFVKYKFVNGSPPQVIAVQPETPWDTQLPLNPDFGGLTGNAVSKTVNFAQTVTAQSSEFPPNGIFDPVTSAFWLNGQADPNMWFISSFFLARSSSGLDPAPPYLRLTLGTPGHPGSGYSIERMDNRIWASPEDDYAVDAGISNPMFFPSASLVANTPTGSVTFIASASVFTAANVGDIIRMSGGIAQVTGYTSGTNVTGTWVLAGSDGPAFYPSAAPGEWSISTPVTGLEAPHLAGMTDVVGLADGVPIGPLTVGGAPLGAITLPFPASDVKVGLPFTAQMQTPYMNGPQVTQGARKVIPSATLRVAGTANGFQIGTNQPDGGAQDPQQLAPAWTNMTTANTQAPTGGQTPRPTYTSPGGATVHPKWTGDILVLGDESYWITKGQVAVQQTGPASLQVTAVMPDMEPGDLPEETSQPTPGPSAAGGGNAGPSQPRPPGPWMLTGKVRM